MSVALKAVNGVDKVKVSLNRGNAIITMKPGNRATFVQMQQAITKNGFAVKETRVEAAGEIVSSAKQAFLKVTGTGDRFPLVFANADAQRSFDELGSTTLVVRGTLPETKAGKLPERLTVDAVLPAKATR